MYNQFNDNEQQANEGFEQNTFTGGQPEDIFVEATNVRTKKSGRFKRGIAYTLVFGLVAGGTFGGVMLATQNNNQTAQVGSQVAGTSSSDNSSSGSSNSAAIVQTNSVSGTTVNDVSQVVSEVMPSIVSLTCTSTVQGNYWGQTYSQEQQGSGSGIIVGQKDDELLIATNNHVVSGAEKVEVYFCDDTSVDATVKGTDSSNDLAVVSVKLSDLSEDTRNTIRVATLGDSDEAQVGEMVIAIGNALGYGQSVTVGYLSAKDREVQTEDYTMSLLQTDAAINPGNSGGALLNAAGQVIGINSVKYSSTEVEGIGYAIPISYAVPIINDLMNREEVSEEEQGYLGIKFNEVTETIAERFNMPQGIFVTEVVSGSPAEQGGLSAGDVITGMDGRTFTTLDAFQELLQSKKAGTEVTLTVQRVSNNQYKEVEVKVTLGNKPASSTTQNNGQSNSQGNQTYPGRQ